LHIMRLCKVCKVVELDGKRFNRKDPDVCRHCSSRILVWGYNGTKKIYELAKKNEDISIDDAIEFCEEYYIGKCKKTYEKLSTFKTSLKILDSSSRVIGRKRKYNDYYHVRFANLTYQKNHFKKDCCEICESKEELHLHHIVPVSWGGALFAPDDVITVCESCHREIHKRLRKVLNKDLLIRFLSPYSEEIIRKAKSVVL